MATSIVTSLLAQLREKLNRMRERELAVALKRLPDLTPMQRVTVERLSQTLMKKFMHEPSVRLRATTANGRDPGVVDAARYLFALEDAGDTEGRMRINRAPSSPAS